MKYVVLLALAVAPFAMAAGPVLVEGTIGAPTIPYVDQSLDKWSFDVSPGDVISAHLSWSDPDASLTLELVAAPCANEECFTEIPQYSACTSIENGLTGNERTVTVDVTEATLGSVMVSAQAANGPVAYVLSFSLNGEAPEIDFTTNEGGHTPHRQHVCHLS